MKTATHEFVPQKRASKNSLLLPVVVQDAERRQKDHQRTGDNAENRMVKQQGEIEG